MNANELVGICLLFVGGWMACVNGLRALWVVSARQGCAFYYIPFWGGLSMLVGISTIDEFKFAYLIFLFLDCGCLPILIIKFVNWVPAIIKSKAGVYDGEKHNVAVLLPGGRFGCFGDDLSGNCLIFPICWGWQYENKRFGWLLDGWENCPSKVFKILEPMKVELEFRRGVGFFEGNRKKIQFRIMDGKDIAYLVGCGYLALEEGQGEK